MINYFLEECIISLIKPYLNLKSIRVHGAEIERFLKITKNMKEIRRVARSAKPERQSAILPMVTKLLSKAKLYYQI